MLDVTLEGDKAARVAEALDKAHIPLVLIDGWAVGPIAGQCRDRPSLDNPYDYCSLLKALDSAIREKSRPVSQ